LLVFYFALFDGCSACVVHLSEVWACFLDLRNQSLPLDLCIRWTIMPALVRTIAVSHFLRKLRGASQPILVKASDGLLYVLKFARNPQGPNLLFNEVIGTELYKAFGLPVPEWRPLLLTDSFIDSNPACWFESIDGPIRPSAGLCFGSRFLGQPAESVWEILPGSYFGRICNRHAFALAWMLDVCANHCDHRQALFVRLPDGRLQAVFIDHSHMFGGPRGINSPHPITPRFLDHRVYEDDFMASFWRSSGMLDATSLWNLLKFLPADWQSMPAIGHFHRCIEQLTDRRRLFEVCNTIADIQRGTSTGDRDECQSAARTSAAILCPDIRRAASLRNPAA
jgi:hypothetical protein